MTPPPVTPPWSGGEPLVTRGDRAFVAGVARAFWIALAAVGAVALTLILLGRVDGDSRALVARTREISRLGRQSMALAIDRETGVRGYLLTGDSISLAPELAARLPLAAKLDTLERLIRVPEQRARLGEVRRAVAEWEQGFAEPVLASPRAPAGDELAGKALFDVVRQRFTALIDAEDALYRERVARDHRIRRAAVTALLVELVVVAGVLVWQLRRLLTQARMVVEQQELLEQQAIELEHQAEELSYQVGESQALARDLEMSNESLAGRDATQRFLLDLSATLDRLVDPDAVAATAVTALGARLAVERCFLLEVDRGPRTFLARGTFDRDAAPLAPGVYPMAAFGEAAIAEGEAGRTLVVRDTRSDARTATAYEETYRGMGIGAFIAVPLHRGGRWTGTLLAAASVPRDWTDEEVALARQVAERVWPPLENTRLLAELRDANRALAATSYTMAHDLRSPLRAVDGHSVLLARRLGDGADAEASAHINRIRANAQRMGRLIDGLLALARIGSERVRRETVDLGALAHASLEDLRAADADRVVEARLGPDLIAHGDPRLLGIVMQNLIGNSWKFTAGREQAVIDVGRAADGERPFFVRDNGVGFSAEFAGQLFQPFRRLHREEEFQGHGIGLATVRRIVERHGGRVWAEGEVGRGATIYFTLGAPAT